MRKVTMVMVLLLLVGCSRTVLINGQSRVVFASVAAGRQVLLQEDEYVRALSPFALQSHSGAAQPLSRQEFMQFQASCVQPWQHSEIIRLRRLLREIARQFEPYDLRLPREVLLVKTNGQEESDAAYTRANAIFLTQEHVSNFTPKLLQETIVHEFFHVLSRQNPQWQDELYGMCGFLPAAEIVLPEELKQNLITNPDAPIIRHYCKVAIAGDERLLTPIIYSDKPYDPVTHWPFLVYLKFQFLELEWAGEKLTARLENQQPVWHEREALPTAVLKNWNTNYLWHPEEIMACNFQYLVAGKRCHNPRIQEQLALFFHK